MYRLFIMLALCAAMLGLRELSPVSSVSASSAYPAPTAIPYSAPSRDFWRLVLLINERRKAAGVGPLAWSEALYNSARFHTLSMLGGCGLRPYVFCGQYEPDLDTRVAAFGYHKTYVLELQAYQLGPDMVVAVWDNPQIHWLLVAPWMHDIGCAAFGPEGGPYYFACDLGYPAQ